MTLCGAGESEEGREQGLHVRKTSVGGRCRRFRSNTRVHPSCSSPSPNAPDGIARRHTHAHIHAYTRETRRRHRHRGLNIITKQRQGQKQELACRPANMCRTREDKPKPCGSARQRRCHLLTEKVKQVTGTEESTWDTSRERQGHTHAPTRSRVQRRMTGRRHAWPWSCGYSAASTGCGSPAAAASCGGALLEARRAGEPLSRRDAIEAYGSDAWMRACFSATLSSTRA